MPDIRLLGLSISVYTRIARLALEEKGVAYQFEEVDVFAESGVPADYLALNPFGMIPTLLHGDLDYYYLTGDRRAREVAIEMAAWWCLPAAVRPTKR